MRWGVLALVATIAGDGFAAFNIQSGEQVMPRTPVTAEQHAAFAEAVRRSRPLFEPL